jgi:hypothetical protein
VREKLKEYSSLLLLLVFLVLCGAGLGYLAGFIMITDTLLRNLLDENPVLERGIVAGCTVVGGLVAAYAGLYLWKKRH